MRQMTLVAFLQAQNCTNFVGSWRHPEAAPDFTSAEYYRRIARTLEAGKFHIGFFDDRLAMPDRFGSDHTHTVANGIRCVKMDPMTILTVMGMATARLGLGSTYSTSYYEPFHVARVFATLDLMTSGRAAWNVVTSLNDGEALNMGHAAHPAHDLRYDRADEFMEVVIGHWDTWEDGAIILDKAAAASPIRPRCTARPRGRFFNSRGPFTVPRSAQGHPVIMQAGQSGRGRRSPRAGRNWSSCPITRWRRAGRTTPYSRTRSPAMVATPTASRLPPACTSVVAETRAEAEDKVALIDSLPKLADQLSLLSELVNYDFARKGLDEQFSQRRTGELTGGKAVRRSRYHGHRQSQSERARFHRGDRRGTFHDHVRFIGTPRDVADGMEQWLAEPACDGFVVAASHVPGAYEDFVRLVVPELQRRGMVPQGLRRPDAARDARPAAARGWRVAQCRGRVKLLDCGTRRRDQQ